MQRTISVRLRLLLPCLLLLLAACTTTRAPHSAPLADAGQIVMVTSSSWDASSGQLQRYERDRAGDGIWRPIGNAVPVMLGRSGSAWGRGLHAAQTDGPQKREGDGRAPAGVFAIGEAFGYAATGIGALPYLPMQASHYCVDVAGSPLYNRIVDAAEVGPSAVAGASEHMRLDLHNNGDIRYRHGFVIAHNADGIPGQGSCIFAHLLRRADETTAGCTAMDETALEDVLRWLDPTRTPRFVLLPRSEHARLAGAWQLPPHNP